MKNIPLVILFTILFGFGANAQTIYFVNKATGSDANAGTSWAASFQNLTKALAAANSSTAAEVDIWVAQGMYHPIDGIAVLPADARDTSFTFYRGNGVGKALKVYGGFAGTETSLAARDTNHITYLDGIVDASNPDSVKHSYHVVVITGLAAGADSLVLDGLYVRYGMANTAAVKNYNGTYVMGYNGGGMAMMNNATSKLVVRNCMVRSNVASKFGVDCSTFIPTVDIAGGGVFDSSSNAGFYSCSFDDNVLGRHEIFGCVYTVGPIGGNAFGGGMYIDTSLVVIQNCIFNANVTYGVDNSYSYAAPSGDGGGLYIKNCSPDINNSSFSNNNADFPADILDTLANLHGGGAVFMLNSSASFSNCFFIFNVTYGSGGAIYNDHSNANFLNCNISGNGISPTESANPPGGSGMCNYYSNPLLTNCIINSNIAYSADPFTIFGGGIWNNHASPQLNNCTIDSNSFVGGIAYGSGVANTFFSQPVFINCSISNNEGVYGAGVANLSGSQAYFRGCNISNNHTFNAAIPYPYGGGAYNENASTTFLSCVFNSNYAYDGYGGGIASINCHTSLDSCVFSNNRADNNGGALFQHGDQLVPTNCVFSGNKGWFGGAVYVSDTNTRFISNANVYADNIALVRGSAIFLDSATHNTDSITNNIFLNNLSWGVIMGINDGAGAVSLGDGHFSICNNTFYKNALLSSSGGAIVFWSATGNYIVANNIFYADSADYGDTVMNAVTDTGFRATGATLIFQHNSMSAENPMFVNENDPIGPDGIWRTADDGLRLQQCSPAIDAGSNAYLAAGETTDITGQARINGITVDKGAYEGTSTGGDITGGAAAVCRGSTMVLTDTAAGGTWGSSNTAIATVSPAGIVNALAGGIDTVTYAHAGVCGMHTNIKVITVETPAAAIDGPDTVCVTANILLNDSTAGGTWIVNNTDAVIDIAGTLTGVSPGIDTVRYTLSNSCGVTTAVHPVVIESVPVPGTVSGPNSVCQAAIITLNYTGASGTWTLQNGNAGEVSPPSAGSITLVGNVPGMDTVFYTLTNACGSARTAFALTVNTLAYCDSVLQVAETVQGKSLLSIYPNPAGREVTINLSSAKNEPATVVMTTVTGAKIKEWTITTNTPAATMLDVPAGFYLLSISEGDVRYTAKLVVE